MPLPEPEIGLVIFFSYLWRHENLKGQNEGRKNRPCVIVLAIENGARGKMVTVAPITHTMPENAIDAVEIPSSITKHLGLDDARSWVVVIAANQFVWPGFDLYPLPGAKDRYDYGFLPPRLFESIKTGFLDNYMARRMALTKRG